MDWHEARCRWVDAEGREHATSAGTVGLTYALVTWLDDKGAECQTEGTLIEVNQEQVIVDLGPLGVCFIPRRSVKHIASLWKTTAAPTAGNGDSSTDTRPTPSVKSAADAGSPDGRDVSGTMIEGWDY